MTLVQLYNMGKKSLIDSNIDDASFDSICLLEFCLSITRHDILMAPNKEISDTDMDKYLNLIKRRASHEPLQYIIKRWKFMNMDLKVGPGVLIPREDTQTLVEHVSDRCATKGANNILDLCAGSGAVGLGLASILPYKEITFIELYNDALKYLNDNVDLSGFQNMYVIKDDVLNPKKVYREKFDIIVSNPPYIKRFDIDNLQEEVKKEPYSALDGGCDGLEFYRAIAGNWFDKLTDNALVAVEIGLGQENDVVDIFKKHGLYDIKTEKDFNGINRVVSGIYRAMVG